MKIFELQHEDGEKEWIAANTVIKALECYFKTTSMEFWDLHDEADIVEVPEEKWSEMYIKNIDYDPQDPEDWQERTFKDWMDNNKNYGPDILCGTMYE